MVCERGRRNGHDDDIGDRWVTRLVFLLLSLLRVVLAGEFSSMWRTAFVDVPAAFLATALTVVVASALLAMVDEASATLLGSDGEQLAAFGQSLTDVEQLSVAGLLGTLFGLLFIVGAVLVWIQLLVRAALIYIVTAFAPITWVTRAYAGTRNIARRGAEDCGCAADLFFRVPVHRFGHD